MAAACTRVEEFLYAFTRQKLLPTIYNMQLQNILNNKTQLHTTILIILYVVGVIGISIWPAFSALTPYNLIVSAFLMLYGHAKTDNSFFINAAFIWIAAFVLEMTGTQTGRIFGEYTYGESLGIKIANTPVIIGLNWIIVAYCSIQMGHAVLKNFPLRNVQAAQLALALFGGVFMVILDLFIEPVAGKLNFWFWNNNLIPVQNFTAWFCFGTAFCYWMIKSGMMQNNMMGFRLYLIQLIFFAIINLTQLI